MNRTMKLGLTLCLAILIIGVLTAFKEVKPKQTLIFYSSDANKAIELTKSYIKKGYTLKSYQIVDDGNTGSQWTHNVVIMEK